MKNTTLEVKNRFVDNVKIIFKNIVSDLFLLDLSSLGIEWYVGLSIKENDMIFNDLL